LNGKSNIFIVNKKINLNNGLREGMGEIANVLGCCVGSFILLFSVELGIDPLQKLSQSRVAAYYSVITILPERFGKETWGFWNTYLSAEYQNN